MGLLCKTEKLVVSHRCRQLAAEQIKYKCLEVFLRCRHKSLLFILLLCSPACSACVTPGWSKGPGQRGGVHLFGSWWCWNQNRVAEGRRSPATKPPHQGRSAQVTLTHDNTVHAQKTALDEPVRVFKEQNNSFMPQQLVFTAQPIPNHVQINHFK